MTHFLVLCYLGFWGAHPYISQVLLPPPQPLPPPYFSASPPRHLQSRLVSPPQSSPSHSMPGVGREAPESTMPRCASGEVCEEPAAAASSSSSPSSQAATDTQTGPAPRWIAPVNPTCLAAWSSPASTHLIKYTTLPLQAPEVLNLFTPPPTQPPPTPAGAPHITLPKNPQEEYFFFFLWVKGSVEALHLHGHFWTTPASLRLQPPQTNPIATVNLIISSPALFMLGSLLRTPCTSSSLGVCDKTLEI